MPGTPSEVLSAAVLLHKAISKKVGGDLYENVHKLTHAELQVLIHLRSLIRQEEKSLSDCHG